MDKLLGLHQEYVVAYTDDVIIFSSNWDHQLLALWAVLQELRGAGLMANPKKCSLGKEATWYLGFQVGQGQIRSLMDKGEGFPRIGQLLLKIHPEIFQITAPLSEFRWAWVCTKVQQMPEVEQTFQRAREAISW